jgi:hypothetical protein
MAACRVSTCMLYHTACACDAATVFQYEVTKLCSRQAMLM